MHCVGYYVVYFHKSNYARLFKALHACKQKKSVTGYPICDQI